MLELSISHPLPTCFLLGVFGGIIRYLDLILKDKDHGLRFSELAMRALIAGFCSLVIAFLLFDLDSLSMNQRYGLSALSGYGGTSVINNLMNNYFKRIGGILRFIANQSNDSKEDDDNG